MSNTEHKPGPQDFDYEVSSEADADDIETPIETSYTAHEVVDFPTGEAHIAQPGESREHAEQVKLLEDSIALLKEDLAEVKQRGALLEDAERYLELGEQIEKQKQRNWQIIDRSVELKKLNAALGETKAVSGLFNKMKQAWTGLPQYPPEYYQLQEKIDKITQEQIELWRERKDESGNPLDVAKLAEEKSQLKRDLEGKLEMIVGPLAVAFPKKVERMRDEAAGDLEKMAAIAQEISKLEQELALLKVFKT